jgi:hypothetical protein
METAPITSLILDSTTSLSYEALKAEYKAQFRGDPLTAWLVAAERTAGVILRETFVE